MTQTSFFDSPSGCAVQRDSARDTVAPILGRVVESPERGETLKREGMAQADAAELDFWKDRADAAIKALAAEGRDFTAEDVRHLAGSPSRPNAFGSRFLSAAKRGLIRKVGYRNSSRPSLHAHPTAVWAGVSK